MASVRRHQLLLCGSCCSVLFRQCCCLCCRLRLLCVRFCCCRCNKSTGSFIAVSTITASAYPFGCYIIISLNEIEGKDSNLLFSASLSCFVNILFHDPLALNSSHAPAIGILGSHVMLLSIWSVYQKVRIRNQNPTML